MTFWDQLRTPQGTGWGSARSRALTQPARFAEELLLLEESDLALIKQRLTQV